MAPGLKLQDLSNLLHGSFRSVTIRRAPVAVESFLKPIPQELLDEAEAERKVPHGTSGFFAVSDYEDEMQSRMRVKEILFEACGGFSSVYLADDLAPRKDGSNDGKCALKVWTSKYCGPKNLKLWYIRARREIHCIKQSQHENVVKLLDSMFMELHHQPGSLAHSVLKLEVLDTDLLRVMRKRTLRLDEVQKVGLQVCKALDFIHSKNIVHHDLKLDNIMVKWTVPMKKHYGRARLDEALPTAIFKIIDFNVSVQYPEHERLNRKLAMTCDFNGGTDGYLSFEKHACGKTGTTTYNPYLADTFALGTTLVALQVGVNPAEKALQSSNFKIVPLFKDLVKELEPELAKKFTNALMAIEGMIASEHVRIPASQALALFESS